MAGVIAGIVLSAISKMAGSIAFEKMEKRSYPRSFQAVFSGSSDDLRMFHNARYLRRERLEMVGEECLQLGSLATILGGRPVSER